MECLFCQLMKTRGSIVESESACVLLDEYPVSPGHLLIIPRKHIGNWFDVPAEMQHTLISLVNEAKEYLEATYSPDGYNIGLNCGLAAGQTIMHVHIHLIPRYAGDMEVPRGGVRGVIPERQSY